MLSTVRLSFVGRLFTFVHPTQPVEIFSNISSPFGTMAIRCHPRKFYGDRRRGTLRWVKRKRGSQI